MLSPIVLSFLIFVKKDHINGIFRDCTNTYHSAEIYKILFDPVNKSFSDPFSLNLTVKNGRILFKFIKSLFIRLAKTCSLMCTKLKPFV